MPTNFQHHPTSRHVRPALGHTTWCPFHFSNSCGKHPPRPSCWAVFVEASSLPVAFPCVTCQTLGAGTATRSPTRPKHSLTCRRCPRKQSGRGLIKSTTLNPWPLRKYPEPALEPAPFLPWLHIRLKTAVAVEKEGAAEQGED